MRASSAPESVIILNVEPGGCRPENATPARPRISPVFGLMTATPPNWPPSAWTAAPWIVVSIVVRTDFAWSGVPLPSTRLPASSVPPGRPRSSESKTRSRPVVPTVASSGTPSARSSSARAAGIAPIAPAIAEAAVPSGEVRSTPWASGVPLRKRRFARGGSCVLRLSRCPRSTPGNVRFCVHATRAASSLPSNGRRRVAWTVPKTRVVTVIGTLDGPVVLQRADLPGLQTPSRWPSRQRPCSPR